MYVFGPVPSRRLGTSLGIDLVKHKTCSLDCIYCECGETTDLTVKRRSFFPVEDVLNEIDHTLSQRPYLDYITFSGSGEPTLSKDIGRVIDYLNSHYPEYKTALLTNSTLLTDESLRDEILPLDLIIPSINAVTEDIFQKMNKPHRDVGTSTIIKGLLEFRKSYKGMFWIELFIVPNINDNNDEIEKIKEICLQLSPDKIQLNTLDRPAPHNNSIKAASWKSLSKIKEILAPLPVEITTSVIPGNEKDGREDNQALVLKKIKQILSRRPSTVDDLSESLGLRIVEINKYLRLLENEKILLFKDGARGRFYYVESNVIEEL